MKIELRQPSGASQLFHHHAPKKKKKKKSKRSGNSDVQAQEQSVNACRLIIRLPT